MMTFKKQLYETLITLQNTIIRRKNEDTNMLCWKFNNIVKTETVYFKTGGVTEKVSSEES